MQEVIARGCIDEAGDKVVHSKRQLRICKEAGVRFLAHIRGARGIRSYRLGAGLNVRAQHRAIGIFKLELSEKRFNARLECWIVGDSLGQVRAANFFSFVSAERCEKEVSPVVHLARAYLQIKLEVGNKFSNLIS